MQSQEKDNLILIRLFSGENLFREMNKVCEKHHVKVGVILSGIGQLKNFQLGYFKGKGNYSLKEFSEPHELLSLSGNIIFSEKEKKYKIHLHALLGDKEKRTLGGHLFKGEVEITNEIVLLKANVKVKRKLEKETGLEGMFLEEE